MEKIKLRITDNRAEVVECPQVITSGTVGLPVEFVFDDCWANLDRLTVFRAGDVAVTVKEPAVVPWEVLGKPNVWLQIGVYGVNADGTVVIPTLWASVCVIHTGADPGEGPVSEPTRTFWQEMREQIDTVKNDAVSKEVFYGHISDEGNPHGVTAAQVGAAPVGYGLGGGAKKLTSADDLDNTWECGYYSWHNTEPAHAPSFGLPVGKLYACGAKGAIAGVSGGNITFNNAVVDVRSGWKNTPINTTNGDIIINGGEITGTPNTSPLLETVTSGSLTITDGKIVVEKGGNGVNYGVLNINGDITVNGNSDLYVKATHDGFISAIQTHGDGDIIINDGKIYAETGTHSAFRTENGEIIINGGVVEAYCVTNPDAGAFWSAPILAAGITGVAGDSPDNVSSYDATKYNNLYVKLRAGGKASANITEASAQATEASPKKASFSFYKWRDFTITEGGEARYYATSKYDLYDENGVLQDVKGGTYTDGDANNWNIKFEYPTGGLPTVTLKDVWLGNAINGKAYRKRTVNPETGAFEYNQAAWETAIDAFAPNSEFDLKVILMGDNHIDVGGYVFRGDNGTGKRFKSITVESVGRTKYTVMHVTALDEHSFLQEVTCIYYGAPSLTQKRTKTGTLKGEWEWVNPPMQLNEEYRTTERFDSKTVYTKLIDFGALPNTNTKSVYEIPKNATIVDMQGIITYIASAGNVIAIPINYGMKIADFYADASSGYVAIKTTEDLSARTAKIFAKYTKG